MAVTLDENAFDADDSYTHIRGSPFVVGCSESWQPVAGVSGMAPGARDHLRLWSKGGKLYVASEDKVEGEEEECEGENSGYGLEWLRSWPRKMDEGRRCQKR